MLRDGLKWHDGNPVTAEDCVASLKRWSVRDPLGKMLMADTASLDAADAKTLKLVLKQPFPLLLEVLGKPNAPLPVMMPARLAATPADQRIGDPVGSGPFRFLEGPVAARQRHGAGTQCRLRAAQGSARISWPAARTSRSTSSRLRVMPDPSTGANALMAGEIDYMQYLPFDMLPLLEKDKSVKLMGLDGIHQFQGNFRLNHAFPPFDNPAVRKVMWKLVDQDATLTAIGVPERYRSKSCPSFWMCGTPLTTDAGASVAKVDLAAAKAELKASGYKGEPVIILEVAGSISQTASRVLVQNMRDVGFTVEQQPRDWPTVLARRAKKDGWSMFPVYSNGTDMYSPLTHFYVAATCNDFPGWSCDNRVPELLKAFTRAATLDERKKIAAEIQVIAYEMVPSLMWGQFTIPAGYRSDLKGLIQSVLPDVLGGRSLHAQVQTQRGREPLRARHRAWPCRGGLSRARRSRDLHAHRGAAGRRGQGHRRAPRPCRARRCPPTRLQDRAGLQLRRRLRAASSRIQRRPLTL